MSHVDLRACSIGPGAWHVTLTDHLSSEARFLKVSTTSGHCDGPRTGTQGATVTCHLGKIKSDSTGARRIRITVTATASQGVITDAARVKSVTPDPLRNNNTATVQTKIMKK